MRPKVEPMPDSGKGHKRARRTPDSREGKPSNLEEGGPQIPEMGGPQTSEDRGGNNKRILKESKGVQKKDQRKGF